MAGGVAVVHGAERFDFAGLRAGGSQYRRRLEKLFEDVGGERGHVAGKDQIRSRGVAKRASIAASGPWPGRVIRDHGESEIGVQRGIADDGN